MSGRNESSESDRHLAERKTQRSTRVSGRNESSESDRGRVL